MRVMKADSHSVWAGLAVIYQVQSRGLCVEKITEEACSIISTGAGESTSYQSPYSYRHQSIPDDNMIINGKLYTMRVIDVNHHKVIAARACRINA